MKTDRPRMLVYRTKYPLISEAFITEQVRSYRRYAPTVLCRERVSISDEPGPVIAAGPRSQQVLFTLTGRAKGFSALRGEILHAHFAPDGLLARSVASRLRIPLVVTCHGSDVTRPPHQMVRSGRLADLRYVVGRPDLLRAADMFIAVSEFVRRKMIEAGFPSSKIVRHYIGVDPVKIQPEHSSARSPSHIVSIARHEDVKGLDTLLHAVEIAARTCPSVRLTQIGGGSRTQLLRSMVSKLGIGNRVTFTGPLSHENTLQILRSAGMLVLSSRKAPDGAEEALGIVLLEAAASGVPVVGTFVGGIPEAVIHGKTGLIVKPDSAQDLAQAMVALASNDFQNQQFGGEGRKMVISQFDIRKQTEELEVIYDEVRRRSEFAKLGSS